MINMTLPNHLIARILKTKAIGLDKSLTSIALHQHQIETDRISIGISSFICDILDSVCHMKRVVRIWLNMDSGWFSIIEQDGFTPNTMSSINTHYGTHDSFLSTSLDQTIKTIDEYARTISKNNICNKMRFVLSKQQQPIKVKVSCNILVNHRGISTIGYPLLSHIADACLATNMFTIIKRDASSFVFLANESNLL